MEEIDDFPEMTPEEQTEYEKRRDCKHEFIEEYYGHCCKKCGTFYPHGGAPWDVPDEDDDSDDYDDFGDDGEFVDEYDDADEEDDDLDECGLYEGTCLLAGTEYCDFECPIGRKAQ